TPARAPGKRRRDPPGFGRSRRDPVALGSDTRDVWRPHRGRSDTRGRQRARAQPAHGGRRGRMRPRPSMLRRAEVVLVPLINLLTALLLSALVVLATGADPVEALRTLATGAAGDGASIGYTLYYA